MTQLLLVTRCASYLSQHKQWFFLSLSLCSLLFSRDLFLLGCLIILSPLQGGFGKLLRSGGLGGIVSQMASTLFGHTETEDSLMHTFGESEGVIQKIAEQFRNPVALS